jgi:hypothetical protein
MEGSRAISPAVVSSAWSGTPPTESGRTASSDGSTATAADGSLVAAADDVGLMLDVALGAVSVGGAVAVGLGDGRGGMQPETAKRATATSVTTWMRRITRARDA